MVPKIENGAKLFVKKSKLNAAKPVMHSDVEMSKKTSNTGDAKQKRES